MTTATLFSKTAANVRRTRRAYIGAHVALFEFAQKRTHLRLGQAKSLGGLLVTKGETVESGAKELFGTAKDKAADKLSRTAAIKAKAKVKVDKKSASENTMAKKAVAKPVKPSSKKKITTDKTLPETPAAKSAVKPAAQAGKIVTDKYAPYLAATAKYDADANPVVIKKIVDHLGIALSSRDGKFVACSDEAERKTVATSWLLKKLAVEADAAALDAKITAVCETMKADRMKNRVAFYYLLAKNEGKLGSL